MPRNEKRLSLLALGGTIACVKTRRGLKPGRTAAEVLSRVPLPKGVTVDATDLLERTIVFPADWITLAKAIHNARLKHDGYVVTLGTDTLAHAAAALAVMLQNVPTPVVLTGAMRPPGQRGSDAQANLSGALRVAASGAPGVMVFFDGQIMDGRTVTKVHTQNPHAFESVNAPPLGTVKKSRLRWRRRPRAPRDPFWLDTRLDTRVALLKLIPQQQPADLEHLFGQRGVIVEGYGDGNVPNHLVPVLRRLARRRVVVLKSQCSAGPTAHRYEGGAALIQAGALSAGTDTTELATLRLMHALGRARSFRHARQLFRSS